MISNIAMEPCSRNRTIRENEWPNGKWPISNMFDPCENDSIMKFHVIISIKLSLFEYALMIKSYTNYRVNCTYFTHKRNIPGRNERKIPAKKAESLLRRFTQPAERKWIKTKQGKNVSVMKRIIALNREWNRVSPRYVMHSFFLTFAFFFIISFVYLQTFRPFFFNVDKSLYNIFFPYIRNRSIESYYQKNVNAFLELTSG